MMEKRQIIACSENAIWIPSTTVITCLSSELEEKMKAETKRLDVLHPHYGVEKLVFKEAHREGGISIHINHYFEIKWFRLL